MKRGNIKLFHKVSIKSKFLMMILSTAMVCIAVIGFQGLHYGKDSLTKSMYDHLTSLKSARTQQIESYFQDKRSLMKTFSTEHTIIDAMSEFSAGFNLLDIYKVDIDKNASMRLNNFYENSFVEMLNENSIQEYSHTSLVPKKEVVKYLQYNYIVNNPVEVGKKDLLESAEDKSYYTEVHQKFHHTLRDIVKNQGFDDLFLIDSKNLNIVYSVSKEVDFGSSLKNGKFAQSSLAKVVKDVISHPDKGIVRVVDFKNYEPSYNTPQIFFAVPIYKGSEFLGVLATQITVDAINNITTGYKNWSHDGLGESGEVYLVGRDYTMRSDARKIIEQPEVYFSDINKIGLDKDSIKLITAIRSTVLNQLVRSEAVKRATEGDDGTVITRNYLGEKVLSAYAPLNLEGLDWSIIAEKEISEAEQPIKEFQKALLISSTILATLITFYAIWLAYSFLAPINSMANGVKNIINTDKFTKINLSRDDEFGELSNNIDKMIDTIKSQSKEIANKSKENDALLLNILPQSIAQRVKAGEKDIAEKVSNVAVLFSNLKGFDNLSQGLSSKESIKLLNEIINEFDNQAQKFGIEKITTIGDSYMAASGLMQPRLDYARKLAEYAHKMFFVIDDFNRRHASNLQLVVGIDSGEVMAGIVGEHKFVYDIWGESVNLANNISHQASLGTIRVSQSIYEQLINKDKYKKCSGEILTYETIPKDRVS